MLYSDLTEYEKRRFNREYCPICGHLVSKEDNFEMLKVKNSRCIEYRFLHRKCLRKRTKAANIVSQLAIEEV